MRVKPCWSCRSWSKCYSGCSCGLCLDPDNYRKYMADNPSFERAWQRSNCQCEIPGERTLFEGDWRNRLTRGDTERSLFVGDLEVYGTLSVVSFEADDYFQSYRRGFGCVITGKSAISLTWGDDYGTPRDDTYVPDFTYATLYTFAAPFGSQQPHEPTLVFLNKRLATWELQRLIRSLE